MSAVRWMSELRFFRSRWISQNKQLTCSARKRQTVPGLESLETLALLSAGGSRLIHEAVRLDHAHGSALVRQGFTLPATNPTSFTQAPVTTASQAVSLAATLTNFTNQALTPNLNLFNPSLGTLQSVTLSYSASVQSQITSQNVSPSSSTVITASLTGSYQIDGLNQVISQPSDTIASQPMPAGTLGSGTDTVKFPPLVISNSSTTNLTDAGNLAFFTSSTGRTAATVTMNAMAAATASAPNGNLFTSVASSAMSTVTVSYTYVPPSTPCPTVTSLGRIGVHHQRTLLVVSFNGTVDATKADNPADYAVILSGGKTVPIKSATFNPTTNSVTLVSSQRLNVHHDYRLSLVIPCPNEMNPETVIIPFGSKYSLIGFHNHKGEFVTVQNGRITGFYNHDGIYIPVHNGEVEKVKG
jgi:hypothetical protein